MVRDGAEDLRLRARSARRRSLHQVPEDPQRRRLRRLHRRRPALPQLAHPHGAARRLRPRPDHRRLPPRGALRRRQAHRAEAAGEGRLSISAPSTDDIIRDREELSEQFRALKELQQMAKNYGFDISRPAANAREAVQWLYFGYLAGVKEQNGAAMSLGRTTTFLDVYFERDLRGRDDDRIAGAGDHRRLRHQAAHRPLPADAGVRRSLRRRPDVGHRVDRRDGRRRPIARDEVELPDPADALQPRPGARAEPHDLVLAEDCPTGSGGSRRRSPSTPARCSSRATRSCGGPGATTARSRAASRRWSSASRCSSSAPAPTSRSASCTRSTAAATRSAASRSVRRSEPVKGDVLDFDDVIARFDKMMDWLAGVYVNAMNIIHYMHDKYAYERVEMALHDYAPMRTMAFGIAGMSVVADSLSAIKYAKVRRRPRRRPGSITDYQTEGQVPALRQQRQPRRSAGGVAGQHVHEQAAEASDLPQRAAHAVRADDHVERRLRQGHRQHAGRAAPGRAVRPGREPDARTGQSRHSCVRGVGREDPVPRRGRRHLAHDLDRARRGWAGSTRIASRT